MFCQWGIELMFKLWKSGSHLATSRSGNKWRILCEIYIKLLIVLIQHWILLTGLWQIPQRSLTKGVQAIQEQASNLAACVGDSRNSVTAQFSALFPTRGNHDKLSQH
jgi:hypothetical protein